ASPVVFVRKKDGTYRFCIDFRIDDSLDSLEGACLFSTVDLSSGYWQVQMAPQDHPKTAFTTGNGLYQFKVMPMGLTNAPPTFLVLQGCLWDICLVYLDDVIIFSKSFDQHLKDLAQVFKRFQAAGLKIRPDKCHLARDHVIFLGHEWPSPTSPTEVRAFLGLCSYYHHFIKDFAHIAPLHKLTQKRILFNGQRNVMPFEYLKKALTEPPIITFPDFTKPFLLHCDASKVAMGAVLSQVQQHQEKVIAYVSHVLTPAERNWATYDKDLYAVVWLRKIPMDNDPMRQVPRSPGDDIQYQVVIPDALIPEVLNLFRGHLLHGHVGADKTVHRARQLSYWPFMTQDITVFCKQCLACQSRNLPVPHHKAPLQQIVATYPFEKVAADLTELPLTSKGNRYLLVIMDYFTKYVNLYAVPDQRSVTVAKCFFEHYIRQHGMPKSIHMDQGQQFESDLIQDLCHFLGIRKTRTTPCHAQSGGMVERFKRIFKDQLAKHIFQHVNEWDSYLSQLELAYNATPHSSTSHTPFYLVHGRESRLPLNIFASCPASRLTITTGTPAEYAESLKVRLATTFASALDHNAIARTRQKTYYDRSAVIIPLQKGDLVMLTDPANARCKLAPRWKGPFTIVECVD
uniref:Gypsy retrotransposon integrase-like protein 1 n=1 Tax=Latimeria chalumnae TaxID=7897 RepID=H3AFS8_LATCH